MWEVGEWESWILVFWGQKGERGDQGWDSMKKKKCVWVGRGLISMTGTRKKITIDRGGECNLETHQ